GLLIGTAVIFAPPLVVNTVHVVKHERGRTVWPALGIGAGAAGVALGVAYALPNASSSGSEAGLRLGLGWGVTIEGAANLGMGIWALLLPKESSTVAQRWAIVPMLAYDHTGRLARGIALDVLVR